MIYNNNYEKIRDSTYLLAHLPTYLPTYFLSSGDGGGQVLHNDSDRH